LISFVVGFFFGFQRFHFSGAVESMSIASEQVEIGNRIAQIEVLIVVGR
jgi:hypothetical protein